MKPLHEMIRSENARTMDEIDFKNKFTARLDEAYNYLRDLKQKSDFFTSVHSSRRPSGKIGLVDQSELTMVFRARNQRDERYHDRASSTLFRCPGKDFSKFHTI